MISQTCAKLNNNDFRFIERLLYDYASHDTAITELEAELAEVNDSLEPSPKSPTMSPTAGCGESEKFSEQERWAIMKEENLRIKYLLGRIAERRRHQQAVGRARDAMNDAELEFVRLFYDQGRSGRDCARVMAYEKTKIYNMRHDVVNKVALFTGVW